MLPRLIFLWAIAAALAPAVARAETAGAACPDGDLLSGKTPASSNDVQGDTRMLTDGAVSEEGARWDAPSVVTLATGAASLTYDLGAPRSLSALFVQADANDTYRLWGSLDGAPGSYAPLVELENVRAQMRTFTDAFPDGTVWNSHSAGKGYDVVLLGKAEPPRLDVGAIAARMERNPPILQSLRDVKIDSVVDLLATYATDGPDMAAWLAGVPVNRDFSLKLEYISGLALNQKAADPIYEHMVAGRSYPERAFAAPPVLDAELRRRLGAASTLPTAIR